MHRNITKGMWILLCCILTTLLAGCLPADEKATENHQDPDLVLNQYFDALSKQDYDTMVKLYGGDYESLIGNNPSVAKDDYKKLFENYCTINGGNIVKIDTIIEKTKISDEEYIYKLSFKYLDDTSFENRKQIEYTVKKIDDSFKVMELPPYIP
ncbi:hypothetical protein E8L90_06510 [Brevibacillus antibioticus]|uniref:DUF3887 domain-containing protein n=1 Tax=Brevibacillus antibioticus TaxID=2570228 RepID=A0A4U2Y5U7_9BACL|nr:hypothetical protein [Brevibacillus antibioticus]TKI55132.1 hypothetical protein E8L90_06510 [Brevibacillus antibioticus]